MNLISSKIVVVSALLISSIVATAGICAEQILSKGGILSGELHAMRSRDQSGKHVNTFQLVSEPHRLAGPNGLCNLETGPETFQIVTTSDAEAGQLKGFVGKQISIKANETSCAEQAGQMSDAIVSKWSLVTSH
jgi:hypothetical protein